MWHDWYQQYFQTGPIPDNAMSGEYNLYIVFLSYLVATFASYVALDMSAHLRRPSSMLFRIGWLAGGAFVMGAGIWSMHFVGMLAFIMDMPMTYNLYWTGLSMIVAIVTAAIAFLFFMIKKPRPIHYVMCGMILGVAIPTMHYTGMAGMNGVIIHYYPSLFALSILIAIVAAVASIWLSIKSDHGSFRRRTVIKLACASVMGLAIVGMHYMGMFAAVFTHETSVMTGDMHALDPKLLAIFITIVIVSILINALVLSVSRFLYTTTVKNKNDFLLAVLDNMTGGVVACNAAGEINLFNKAAEELFGVPRKQSLNEWIKQCPFILTSTGKQGQLEDYPLYKALRGTKVKETKISVNDHNGIQHTLLVDGQLLKGIDEENLGAVIVWNDISERQRLDRFKAEFISTVSHELRTPLTSIRGSLGLALAGVGGQLSEKAHNLINIAHKNCERLILLINDILDIEKFESGQMRLDVKLLNLKALVIQAVDLNRGYGEKLNVNFTVREPLIDANVYVDSDRFIQVMANLMSNAAKFSKSGGNVDIAMEDKDNFIRITISDYGQGIPDEFRSRIFGKFAQADSSEAKQNPGTGLGLNISKAIIEKFGGHIGFDSIVGEGTTFYFDLPKPPESEIAVSSNKIFQKRLLVCEDDVDIAHYLQIILQEQGYLVDLAFSAQEAKRLVKLHTYAALTIDLVLPDVNGIQLIQELRNDESLKNIPIVVISANAENGKETYNNCVLGVFDWINKPIEPDHLVKVIQKIGFANEMPTILHVEDDLDIAEIISFKLVDLAKVITAPTLAKAKEIIKTEKIDFILLDMSLPDCSGLELIKIISHLTSKPIIIFSASEVSSDISEQVVAALVKSRTSEDTLVSTIKTLISGEV